MTSRTLGSTQLKRWQTFALAPLLFLALAWASSNALAQSAQIGVAERITGTVTVVPGGGTARPLLQGEAVREGDLVSTAEQSEALIKLRDDTAFTLRPSTQMRFTEFRFERTQSDSFVSNLLRGAVRSVSGLIGKAQPRNVRLVTPTVTVGIRGTDFEVQIVPDGQNERAGVYNYVHDGATAISLASGESLDVPADNTGFAPERLNPGENALQLIRGRPAFLRGGGFDAMMMQLSRPMPMMPLRR